MSNSSGKYFYVGSCGKVKAGVHREESGFTWEVYDVNGSYFNGTKSTMIEAVDYAVKYMLYLSCINKLSMSKNVRNHQFLDFENCGFRNLLGDYYDQ